MPSKKLEVLVYNYSHSRIPKKLIIETIENTIFRLKKNPSLLIKKTKSWKKNKNYFLINEIKELSVIAVTPSKIKDINYSWRKKNQVTTIITFLEGDIFICPQEIKNRAQKFNLTESELYQRLLIHGILHLLGFTHKEEKERKEMEELEEKIFLKIK